MSFTSKRSEQEVTKAVPIGVGREGAGGGGRGPVSPNNLRGGATYPLAPLPNNPPTCFLNFNVKQEKSQMYQVEG